jgi:hypothetical protein
MKRPTVRILVALLLGVGGIGMMVARAGLADSASELGDLSAVAASLGVEPDAGGKYTAASVLEALATRLSALEQSHATASEIAALAGRTSALERSLAMEYASRIDALERQLGDLVSQLEHLGGSTSLQRFVAQLQKDIRDLQCELSPCTP